MNGIPMKLDYSKTINEQLATFEYYKDRYVSYELQIMNLGNEIQKLKGVIETYEILIKANNINNWNELKKWLETMLDSPKDFYSVIRVKDTLEKMQELENRKV